MGLINWAVKEQTVEQITYRPIKKQLKFNKPQIPLKRYTFKNSFSKCCKCEIGLMHAACNAFH